MVESVESVEPNGSSPALPALLTVKQTSQKLGLSMHLVRRLIDGGALTSDWVGGKLYVSTESIERYLENFGRGEESA